MQPFQIRLKPSAEKELNKLPKEVYYKVLAAFTVLVDYPFSGKKLDGEMEKHYSYKVWPYRVIYKVYKKELLIIIVRIGHRQGVYK